MSAFSTIFIRNNEQDFIFFATDSVSVKKYNDTEKYHAITSKSIYLPHLKTSVCVMGSTWLSIKLHSFIDSQRALDSLDGLIVGINDFFLNFYKRDAEELTFTIDEQNKDFLGVIILNGVSRKDISLFPIVADRPRPLLMSRKFLVYKTHVKDCGWINNESDDYNSNFMMEADHPQLSENELKAIEDKNQDLMSKDFYTGSLSILKDKLIQNNRNYIGGGRQTMVTAGEIHATVLSLNKDDKFGEGSTVSHTILHQFNDYEQVKNEIKEFQKI